jgi:hypothetical protein
MEPKINGSEKTVVSQAAAHAMSFDRRNSAYEQGGRYAENRFAGLAIASDAAQTIGTDPTFEEWTEYMTEWKDGYVHQNPENTANAADQAWKRFANQLNELYGLTKPSSKSAAAERKASERAAKAEKLLEQYADQTADQIRDLRRKALEAAAKGNDKAEKVANELKKVLKEKTREENKERSEQLRELRSQIKSAANACNDIDRLQTALDCLDVETELSFITE